MPLLKVGDPVPELSFQTHDRQELPLTSFKGKKNMVVAFYARAFTGG